MSTSQRAGSTTNAHPTTNPNVKIFVAIFLFIAGLVGLVLAVLNASSKPANTTLAIIYGLAGLVLLVGGFLLVRRRRY
ncbi:LPXTG cell wall anchor domain-containing protein [Nakamurella aerolata]|uniref:LPXTG cell wall anchor domain-containing protein n=1 Tax=Nakamurella aerolata TaxID=1656892 RepID=A0A849A925_9ACTN|nr:LPXTG cell wall anchor domain-containing protein [Nakamurella aerolata]NNG37444.1 LPXTG cell wall anchor domain-containing protein [Nakamurella aerolata]